MLDKSVFSVALIGADGAGKTTIAQNLVAHLPLPIKYLYMGVSLDSSNRMLPTTRLLLALKRACGGRPNTAGPPDPTRRAARPKHWAKRWLAEFKSTLRLANVAAEEWFRQCLVWLYQRRGYIVLFDRHFFLDFHFHQLLHPTPQPYMSERLHARMLERLYPRPDLVIFLDAPAEVLFARKREGTIELLEQRRQEYFRVGELIEHFQIVDCARPLAEVAADVERRIREFRECRQRPSAPAAEPVISCVDTVAKGGA